MSKKHLKTINKAELINIDPAQNLTPVQAAMQSGATPAELLEFMKLQERWEENEARKAYYKALSAFKENNIFVKKDMKNSQYNDAPYASKGSLLNTVNPILSQYGLSATFNPSVSENGDMIIMQCILSHEDGHTENVSFPAPPDKSGAKNPIQQMKSTNTYLQIITYEAITGVCSGLAENDDDGNAAGGHVIERISENQALALRALLTDKGIDVARFENWLRRDLKCDGIDMVTVNAYDYVLNQARAAIKRQENKQAD